MLNRSTNSVSNNACKPMGIEFDVHNPPTQLRR